MGCKGHPLERQYFSKCRMAARYVERVFSLIAFCANSNAAWLYCVCTPAIAVEEAEAARRRRASCAAALRGALSETENSHQSARECQLRHCRCLLCARIENRNGVGMRGRRGVGEDTSMKDCDWIDPVLPVQLAYSRYGTLPSFFSTCVPTLQL